MNTPRYDPSTFWAKILFGLAVFGLLCISLHAQTTPPVWFPVAPEAQYQATSPIVELTAGATFTFGRLDGTLCDSMTATAVWIPVWVSSFASGTTQPCSVKTVPVPNGDPNPGSADSIYVLETPDPQFAQVKDPVDGTVTIAVSYTHLVAASAITAEGMRSRSIPARHSQQGSILRPN